MASDTSVKTLVSEVIRCSRERKIHKIIHLMNKFVNWKQKKYLRTFSRWAWWYVLEYRRLRQEDRKFKASLGYTVRLHPWPQLKRLLTTILDTANTHALGTKAMANSLFHSLTPTIHPFYYLSYENEDLSFPSASYSIHYRSSILHWGFCCHL